MITSEFVQFIINTNMCLCFSPFGVTLEIGIIFDLRKRKYSPASLKPPGKGVYFCLTEVSDAMKFKDSDIERFWIDPERFTPRRVPPNCRKALYRKLQILDAACDLRDLRIPPNNRLEKLKGDRAGQYSIRVNSQWRLCFAWTNKGPERIEFCDYHQ